MLSIDDHVRKAEHNESFAKWLLETSKEYYDWVLVAAFYAAVHYVEAALVKKGSPSQDHATRDRGLQKYLRDTYKPYRNLKDLSTQARYTRVRILTLGFGREVAPHLEAVKRQTKFAREPKPPTAA